MNLQGMTVIFAIILLPIVLVVSVYLQGQIDTIALQNQYDKMLINSTYDAVSALERNIANEDLSTVSDSLRSMIEASNNIFMNSLSTNMGVSNANKTYVRPYIPALLYTLYDGFYIYSPTSVPKILEDDKGVAKKSEDTDTYGQILYEKDGGGTTTIADQARKNIEYVLKPYIYYNANYDNGNVKISVNYSLDNYVSITGTVGDVYYSKSGYLINPDLVATLTIDNDISGGEIVGVNFNLQNSSLNNDKEIFYRKYQSVVNGLSTNGKNLLAFADETIISDFCELDGIKLTLTLKVPSTQTDGTIGSQTITIKNYNFDSEPAGAKKELIAQATEAIRYYGKSKIFSAWVKANLNGIIPKDNLKNYDAKYTTTYMGEEKTRQNLMTTDAIFDISGSNNPEDPTSAFCEHKREVIKSSIQYNLNNAISNYSSMSEYEYEMPIISETEWDTILSNVTMVSFMQGLPCKGKTYSNYAIVPSSSSELTVIPENLYYVVASENNNEVGTYHRIGCSAFGESGKYLGYRSIEYIYDKKLEDDHYEYDHKNFGCYECIISGNYDKTEINALSENKKRAYYTVLGKERNNLYKTTSTIDNYGFEVKNLENGINVKNSDTIYIKSNRSLKDIKSIEIVIEKTEISKSKTTGLVDVELKINDGTSRIVSINANKNTTQTIKWENICSNSSDPSAMLSYLSINQISTEDLKKLTTCNVVSIKIIYK